MFIRYPLCIKHYLDTWYTDKLTWSHLKYLIMWLERQINKYMQLYVVLSVPKVLRVVRVSQKLRGTLDNLHFLRFLIF